MRYIVAHKLNTISEMSQKDKHHELPKAFSLLFVFVFCFPIFAC